MSTETAQEPALSRWKKVCILMSLLALCISSWTVFVVHLMYGYAAVPNWGWLPGATIAVFLWLLAIQAKRPWLTGALISVLVYAWIDALYGPQRELPPSVYYRGTLAVIMTAIVVRAWWRLFRRRKPADGEER
jgi:hypothetical protein